MSLSIAFAAHSDVLRFACSGAEFGLRILSLESTMSYCVIKQSFRDRDRSGALCISRPESSQRVGFRAA